MYKFKKLNGDNAVGIIGMHPNNHRKAVSHARRNETDLTHVDFSGLDLTGVNFKGMDLTGCNFNACNLTDVKFSGCNLSDCTFDDGYDKIKFNNTNMSHAAGVPFFLTDGHGGGIKFNNTGFAKPTDIDLNSIGEAFVGVSASIRPFGDPLYLLKAAKLKVDNEVAKSKSAEADVQPLPPELNLNHYRRDVRHIDVIDPYRVCKVFGVTDSEIHHAIKKLLVPGVRGSKDELKDKLEAIRSIVISLVMDIENHKYGRDEFNEELICLHKILADQIAKDTGQNHE